MTFEQFIDEWKNSDRCIEAHTSGSTGLPKMIFLDKEFVRASAIRTNSFYGLSSESRLHTCVSPDFIGGKMMAVRAIECGGHLTWETPSNRPLQALNSDETIDLLAIVPSQMVHILDNIGMMPELRNIIIGGSPIDKRLRNRIIESELSAYETYGMTETASHIALRKIKQEYDWFATLPGISVDLDERSCLVINFTTGKRFVTNDLASVRGNNEFRIEGRYDYIIISGGRKINPFDIESRISELISCPYVVTSIPDEKWGNMVVLKIECGKGDIDEDKLQDGLQRELRSWEMPKRIMIEAHLERTPNGKIKR